MVDRSLGMTTPFGYSGGDPLAVASGWSRGVGHCCVSVRPPMTLLNVKFQEPKVVAQVGLNDRLDLVTDRLSSTNWRQ
jgi:hypothetical protein